MTDHISAGKITGGITLISVGIVLLLNNYGILDWYIWFRIIQLWPVLLIAAGVRLLFRDSYLSLLSPLIIIAAFALAIASPADQRMGGYFPYIPFGDAGVAGNASFSRSLDPAVKNLDLSVDFGAGDLYITGGASGLYNANLDYISKRPSESYHISGDEAKVKIYQRGNFSIPPRKRQQNWEIRLTEKLPVDLRVNAGACQAELDLTNTILKNLNIDCGASKVTVLLGAPKGEVHIGSNSGVTGIRIVLPKGAAVGVKSDSALVGGTDYESLGFEKVGRRWQTPGYDDAKDRFEINTSQGVGSFSLEFADLEESGGETGRGSI